MLAIFSEGFGVGAKVIDASSLAKRINDFIATLAPGSTWHLDPVETTPTGTLGVVVFTYTMHYDEPANTAQAELNLGGDQTSHAVRGSDRMLG